MQSLKIFMQRVYMRQYLRFQNFKEHTLKIIRMFKCPLEKYLKVRIFKCLIIFIEKKTIVFDIDETLVLASCNLKDTKV